MKMKIITDSMIDLDNSIKDEVIRIPLSVLVEKNVILDDDSCDRSSFINILEHINNYKDISTSQPPIGEVEKLFKQTITDGYKILYLAGSSKLSGTYQSANIVKIHMLANKEIQQDDIIIYDTELVSFAGGILVRKALELIKNDITIEELLRALDEQKSIIYPYITVGDLNFLNNGGRISNLKISLAKYLNIFPVLTMCEGSIEKDAIARGMNKVLSKISSSISDIELLTKKNIYIGAGKHSKYVDKLETMILAKYPNLNVIKIDIGITILAHTGYEVFGFALF